MATLDDVAVMALALPGVTESDRHGSRTWVVGGKGFAWERPFSKADLKRYGDVAPPEGPILALAVEDLSDKEAILAAGRPGCFTISHFDGYAAVLLQLSKVPKKGLREAILDAWLVHTPSDLANQHLGRA